MRILFLSNFFPPYVVGGLEYRCQETVDGLHKRGHVCHVLTSRHGVTKPSPLEEGITRALHLEANIDYYRPLDFFLQRSGQEKANQRALREALDSFRPDLIFIWGMWLLSRQIAYWAEQWFPGRVAYSIAGYWPMELSEWEPALAGSG